MRSYLIWFLFFAVLPDTLAQSRNEQIDSLQQVLAGNPSKYNKGKALLEIGYLFQDSLSNTSKRYVEEALPLVIEIEHLDFQRDAYNQLGSIARKQGDYVHAVKYFIEALEISERIGDQVKIGGCLHNLATVEGDQGNKEEAMRYLKKAILLYEESGKEDESTRERMARSYNSLGIAFKNTKEYDSAFWAYHTGIKLVQGFEGSLEIATLYNNLGFLHDILDNLDSARYYFEEAYTFNKRPGRTRNRIFSTMHLSRLARYDKDYELSLKYVKEGLNLADKGGYKYIQGTMYLHLSNTYKGMGLLDSAVWSYEQFVPLNDSVLDADYNKQLAGLRVDFETERKEQQIANLALAKSNAEVRRNAYLIALISICGLMAFIFFWFRYRIRKNRQLKEREIRQYEAELSMYTNRLVEKSVRIEELNQELEKVKEEISDGCPAYNGALDSLMQSTILTYDEWTEFKKLFKQVYPGFFTNLRESYPELTDTEERLFALTRLNLSTREIASMLGISMESVNKSRYRLRKKLNLNTEELEELVENM